MGSKVNSTGLPPALLFRLTTSNVTDTLSPGLTALGIITVNCKSCATSTGFAIVGGAAAAVVACAALLAGGGTVAGGLNGLGRVVGYSGPTMTPPSSQPLP